MSLCIDNILTGIINRQEGKIHRKKNLWGFQIRVHPYQIDYLIGLIKIRDHPVSFLDIITPYIIGDERLFKYIYGIYWDTITNIYDRPDYLTIMEDYIWKCSMIASKNKGFNILEFLCEEWKKIELKEIEP